VPLASVENPNDLRPIWIIAGPPGEKSLRDYEKVAEVRMFTRPGGFLARRPTPSSGGCTQRRLEP
jgi:hypothetical protein